MHTEFPETFDPETQEGNSWDPLPVGEYVAQIVEASCKTPKSGDGCYIALTWKIIEGKFEGRLVFHQITFLHSSEQAQTIGRKTMKDLCRALEINEQVNDAQVFLFKPARILLGIDKDKQGIYPDKNNVRRIRSREPKPAEPDNGGSASSAATGVPKPAVSPSAPAPWHKQR